MSTNRDQQPTTAVPAVTRRRVGRRVLAGVGVAAALAGAVIAGAGIASAADDPAPVTTDGAPNGPDDQSLNERTGLVWNEQAKSWMFSDTSTEVVVDPGNPVVDDKQAEAAPAATGTSGGITAADPDQEYNDQTGLTWNEQAGTWMFSDSADPGVGSM